MYQIPWDLNRIPNDPKAKRYALPTAFEDSFIDSQPDRYTTHTTIDSLGLNVDQAFGYWFNFGDDWWHQINVISIKEKAPRGQYPKVIKRIEESPPQYADLVQEDN